MSASRSSSSPPRRPGAPALLALLLAAALLLAGCAVPGAQRLAGTPDGMPDALAYVPGDSVGWVVAATDRSRTDAIALAKQLGVGPDAVPSSVLEPLTGEELDWADSIEPWIGASVGRALYTLRSDEPSLLTFADVRDRTRLERFLRDEGWTEHESEQIRIDGERLTAWTRSGTAATDGATAVAVADDALVAAVDERELRALLEHTAHYAASERTATVEYTVDALQAAPVAIVLRSDVLRSDLRTLVGDDAALAEMSRWFVQASSIYALRDGWMGAVAGRTKDVVRLIGRMDWARAATQVPEPKPVPKPSSAELAGVRWAVAFRNPGSYLHDVVNAVTDGGSGFTTELDAAKGAPKLEPVLDELDGAALVRAWEGALTLSIAADEPEQLARDVATVLDAFDELPIELRSGVSSDGRVEIGTGAQIVLARPRAQDDAFATAGTPGVKPFAWFYLAESPCDPSRPAAGWMSWASAHQRISFSIGVPIRPAADGELPCGLLD